MNGSTGQSSLYLAPVREIKKITKILITSYQMLDNVVEQGGENWSHYTSLADYFGNPDNALTHPKTQIILVSFATLFLSRTKLK